MRILIVTPSASGVGSPTLYFLNLSEAFKKAGHMVDFLEFPMVFPSGLRHFIFLCSVFIKARRVDVVFSLDHFSVGFPASLACLVLRKKFFVRVGGDFLWERYVNMRRVEISLSDFYEKKLSISLKDRFVRWCISFVFRHATKVIFSTVWQRDIFLLPYRFNIRKTVVIDNMFAKKRIIQSAPILNEWIWGGRMIFLKNLERLIDVFAAFKNEMPSDTSQLFLIGDGPEKNKIKNKISKLRMGQYIIVEDSISHEKLQDRFAGARAVVLPSFSEVSPNFLAEGVSAGKPFIATHFTGYRDYFKDIGIFIDPFNDNDIKNAFIKLSNDSEYNNYSQRAMSFSLNREWGEVAQDYLDIFSS